MKWFVSLDRTAKIILLAIPGLNWFVEVFIRVSDLIEKQDTNNIISAVFAIFVPVLFGWADLIYYLTQDKLLLK